MLGFLIGLMVGGFLGIAVMAMMSVASQADRDMHKAMKKESSLRRLLPVYILYDLLLRLGHDLLDRSCY